MPSLDFVLPHWLYWSTLAIFPLVGLLLVRREARVGPPRNASYPVAYLLWLCGGFIGLHRFYLRSWLGLVYIPLFVGILIANTNASEARLEISAARQDMTKAEFLLERAIERQGKDSEAAGQAQARIEQLRPKIAAAKAEQARVNTITQALAAVLAVLLLVDAVLLPWLIRRYRRRHDHEPPAPVAGGGREEVGPTPPRPTGRPGQIVWFIDRFSGWTGHFLAFWSILAVFAYYYEVIARYVFNSPTNWVHESMFLMFGMLYMLSGAFALREGSHVRVDVLYQYLPRRGRALLDVITSVFFFIFVIAMLWTGWTFASDAIDMGEVSFTEWAIEYWPVKLAIPVGAALILVQGIARVMRALAVLTGWEMPPTRDDEDAVPGAS